MKEVTVYQFIEYHKQIQRWEQTGDVQAFLLSGQIKRFYDENRLRLTTLIKKGEEIYAKYFVLNEGGKGVKMSEATEGSPAKPLLNEGFTMEDFEAEIKEFNQQKISIKK
jgi:hypothetical protein